MFQRKLRPTPASAPGAGAATGSSVNSVAATPTQDGGGYLDWAGANLVDGQAIIGGWASPGEGAQVWLETPDARIELSETFRYVRGDLTASDHVALGRVRGATAGFLATVPRAPTGTPVKLMIQRRGATVQLAEIKTSSLSLDPFATFKSLANTPTGRWAERFARIDGKVIQPLIDQQARWAAGQAVESQVAGVLPADPQVSVIIPLYRRFDFVEPQLMKFSRDVWLRENAELIYVIDDPELVETMRREAPVLARLYGVPFRWVWGQVNRGFSGANNLGVSVSRAARLIFLNSDVFPCAPGWARALCEVLDTRSEIGVVAPRLLHADGTVQHAGMSFVYLPAFGIWSNQHPRKGLPDALVPGQGLEELPAVTGACMAVRRADLDRVGGWDTGYLIGDFEDSDLCLSLQRLGLKSACLHDVRLVHLERQSFRQLGEDGFRTQVVIYNAVRHQQRWGRELERLGTPASDAPVELAP